MLRWLTETVLVLVVSVFVIVAAISALPSVEYPDWSTRFALLISGVPGLLSAESSLLRGPITTLIWEGAQRSLGVLTGALVLVLLVAVPVGLLSATRPQSRRVALLRSGIERISSVPILVWASVAYMVAAREFGVILRADRSTTVAILASVLVLAAGDSLVADLLHRVRDAMQELMGEPHIRTARAARLGEAEHIARGLVGPIFELLASRGVFLVSAAIITERIFNLQGLGYLVVEALNQPDTEQQLLLAAALCLVFVALGLRVMHRVALAIADPRMRR